MATGTTEAGVSHVVLPDEAPPSAESLGAILASPPSDVELLRIAAAAASALGRLHGSGFLHRDVNPSTIWVDGPSGRVGLVRSAFLSPLPGRDDVVAPPRLIVGSLAYIAPEQTGRTNRAVDARADLYSLGVALYEALTGGLPFDASDPVDWVHCHTSRAPAPIVLRSGAPPGVVGEIVMKLLAKDPSDRYQTAHGLAADLRRCVESVERHGELRPFTLGTQEVRPGAVARRLFGRDGQIGEMTSFATEVLKTAEPGLLLLAGAAGVGKSALIGELRRRLPGHVLIGAADIDATGRGMPYGSLIAALRHTVRWMLSLGQRELDALADDLVTSLSPNGVLMTQLVPELERVIGLQSPVKDLPSEEAARRFHEVFGRFVSTVATKDRPLALLVDDLQGLDVATCELLEHMLREQRLEGFLLVGGYRDTEVDAGHPLRRLERAARAIGVAVRVLDVHPLEATDVEALITDLLRCRAETARPLAGIVLQATSGNPLFIHQFVATLLEQQLLWFDTDADRWFWDARRIQAEGYVESLTEVVLQRVARLPERTREALGDLAALGTRASAPVLAAIRSTSPDDIHTALAEAVETGLVVRVSDGYTSPHDRIREAAYGLVPESDRPALHLHIGRVLRAARAEPDAVFEVARHLNRGSELLTDPEERVDSARINLEAALRAQAAVAPATALVYLRAGLSLLPDDAWERHRELAFELHLVTARCRLAAAEFDEGARLLDALAARAVGAIETAGVVSARLDLELSNGRYVEALERIRAYVATLDREWSGVASDEDVQREYDRLLATMGDRSPESLADLPIVNEPTLRATFDVCVQGLPAAYFLDKNLYALIVLYITRASLELGLTEESYIGYANLCLILGKKVGDYDVAVRFGRLAVELLRRRGTPAYAHRALNLIATVIIPRTESLHGAYEVTRRSIDHAERIGLRMECSYAHGTLLVGLFSCGRSLAEIERASSEGLEHARRTGLSSRADYFRANRGLILALQGHTTELGSIAHADFDPIAYTRHLHTQPDGAAAIFCHEFRHLQARYFAGDYEAAADHADAIEAVLWIDPLFIDEIEYQFFAALAYAARARSVVGEEAQRCLERAERFRDILAYWAERVPQNFAVRQRLIDAELCRYRKSDEEAAAAFEECIALARTHRYLHLEALGLELYGAHLFACGQPAAAEACLRSAAAVYLRWGAFGKVRQLRERHATVGETVRDATSGGMVDAAAEQIDLASMIRTLQAISVEIDLDALVERLLKITLQQAGADRGVVILTHAGPRIAAVATLTGGAWRVEHKSDPLSGDALPLAVVNYVLRSSERLVLNDAAGATAFVDDPYLRAGRARSALCAPIVLQSKLIGAVYLENTLTTQAFAPAVLGALELLLAQAGISFEHARLYAELRQAKVYMGHAERLSGTGSFSWRPRTGAHFWSDEVYRLFGGPVPESVAAADQLRRPADKRTLESMAIRAARLGDAPHEDRVQLSDGSSKYLTAFVQDLGSSDDPEYVGAVRDVTDVRRSEEALERTKAALADVSRVATLGEMTAAIAHEVNQPLSAIGLNARACVRWFGAPSPNLEEARQAAERILRDATRATDVIARIRALFRPSTGVRAPVDVHEAVREVVTLVQSRIARTGVSTTVELGAAPPLVAGDRVQLQQVLINLVVNALEAMQAVEGRPRTLRISTETASAGCLRICVVDSGAGISSEARARVFEAFQTTKPHGMGMGLSICKTIIESHAGAIGTSPNPDHGTTFWITLPSLATDGRSAGV